MGDWWRWTRWSVSYIVTLVLVLEIYKRVVQTRFECVIFSMAALIFIELVSEYQSWGMQLLTERDFHNQIHKSIAERLGHPLESELQVGIRDLAKETDKALGIFFVNGLGRWLLWLIIVWNLFKATFF